MFSPLFGKQKSKNIILLKKPKRSFLEVIPSFLHETNVKVLVLWETNGSHIRSSIHDLRQKIWLVKQPIWILSISDGNQKSYYSSLVLEP